MYNIEYLKSFESRTPFKDEFIEIEFLNKLEIWNILRILRFEKKV